MDMKKLYSECRLCPNNCGIDRCSGNLGRCGQSDRIKIAWCGLHRGEEPPVSGKNGSGMIFFCGCPLHCAYCQNYQISTADGAGIFVSTEQLARIMTELQNFGATTLNLVTGTHYIPSVIEALKTAKENGFNLPVVWNSGGYESIESLKLIDPYIDLYLIDVKTLDTDVAAKFCGSAKYAQIIIPVMKFLKHRYSKTNLESKLNGVLVRHLVFPGTIDKTMEFLGWYADNFKDNFYLSLMTQFVPPKADEVTDKSVFLKIKDRQYKMLEDTLDRLGIDGFIQERSDNEILWIPDFNRSQPFPEGFADTLPYFSELR